MKRSEALRIRRNIEASAQSLADNDALETVCLFPAWDELVAKAAVADAGFRFRHGGVLYALRQDGYTFVSHYVPGTVGMESLFEVVNEDHAGTLDDPIPYDGNMELLAGLYYVQGGVVYYCTRGTGTAVYNALSELVGIYVEVV